MLASAGIDLAAEGIVRADSLTRAFTAQVFEALRRHSVWARAGRPSCCVVLRRFIEAIGRGAADPVRCCTRAGERCPAQTALTPITSRVAQSVRAQPSSLERQL
jgi:hypothetical protein